MREGDLMAAVSSLVFLISVISFMVYWRKKYKIRKSMGLEYENDEEYKRISKLHLFSGIVCIGSIYTFIYGMLTAINQAKGLAVTYCMLTACITAVAFIIYWWKKRKARLSAGENYRNDSDYKKISLQKRIIGIVCVVSTLLITFTVPEMTPEERAEYAARQEAKQKAEEERLAAEKKLAEEKATAAKQQQQAKDVVINQKESEKQETIETKPPEGEDKNVVSNDRRVTMDSLEDVSSEELAQQVIEFINNDSKERDKLIDYVLNVQVVKSQNQNLTKEKFQNSLIDALEDYSTIENTAKSLSNSGVVSNRVSSKWLSETLPQKDDIKLYNAKMKIAELNRRFFEANADIKAEEEPSILDLIGGPPKKASEVIFDVISGAVLDAVFSDKEENMQIMKSADAALQNIYENLWIDVDKYNTKASVMEYYESRVPKYLFAYDIEEAYFPQSPDEVDISWRNGSVPKDSLKKLYKDISGEWKSLITGQTITLKDNYENENKVSTYPKMNMVHFCGKNEIFAECDYRGADFGKAGKSAEIFVTTAYFSDDDGNKKKVLIMYADYKLAPQYVNGSNPDGSYGKDDWKYLQNYKVYNIGSAEDVFIREMN